MNLRPDQHHHGGHVHRPREGQRGGSSTGPGPRRSDARQALCDTGQRGLAARFRAGHSNCLGSAAWVRPDQRQRTDRSRTSRALHADARPRLPDRRAVRRHRARGGDRAVRRRPTDLLHRGARRSGDPERRSDQQRPDRAHPALTRRDIRSPEAQAPHHPPGDSSSWTWSATGST